MLVNEANFRKEVVVILVLHAELPEYGIEDDWISLQYNVLHLRPISLALVKQSAVLITFKVDALIEGVEGRVGSVVVIQLLLCL